MSEAQEFGGPINRPASNARQVTPGEALSNLQPSGAGVDFLGLNQQMQGSPAPSVPAPAAEQSWLMEVTESAPRSYAPSVQQLAPSSTATSLLNASWREETPEPRHARWLIPVVGGAVLTVVGGIGLPLLRRTPSPSVVTRPIPTASTGPAVPSVVEQPALASTSSELLLDPVAPDPRLDRPERPRSGKGAAPLAQIGGRSEAPVHAIDPGSSFVTPRDVIDPAGVWTVTTAEDEARHGAEGDVDTSEPIDGSPAGVTTSARGSEGSSPSVIEPEDCTTPSLRRASLPASVEVDWDRLVWIARTGELEPRTRADRAATSATSDASGETLDAPPAPRSQDEGIARAVHAWAAGLAVASSDESARDADESTRTVGAAHADRADASTSSSEPAASEAPADPIVACVDVDADVDAASDPSTPAESLAVAESTASVEVDDASPLESAVEPERTAQPLRVKVLARGSARAAAERRRARAQQQAADSEGPTTDESHLQTSIELAPPSAAVSPVDLGAIPPGVVADVAPSPGRASIESEKQSETSEPPSPGSAEQLAAAHHDLARAPLDVATDSQADAAQAPAPPDAGPVASVRPRAGGEAVASGMPAPGDAATAVQPTRATAPPSPLREPEPQRVLRTATAEELRNVWSGDTIPLEALDRKSTLATPQVGPTRVVFHSGEVFEGDLVAIGEGRVWLRTGAGRVALDGARVKSAQRIAPGASLNSKAAHANRLAGLPRARVKTPGGVLTGRVLERDERVTTIITSSGARIVLESRNVDLLEDVPVVQIRP